MIDQYEIVELKEKHLVGSSKKIQEETPDMAFWGLFYRNYYSLIPQRKNEKVYEIYKPDPVEEEAYQVAIACESDSEKDLAAGLVTVKIPAGRYAKFTIIGEVHDVVPKFWENLKQPSLPFVRKHSCDFEEFPNNETDDVEISIYLSID